MNEAELRVKLLVEKKNKARESLDKLKKEEQIGLPSYEELKEAAKKPAEHMCVRCVASYDKYNALQREKDPTWKDRFPICRGSLEELDTSLEEYAELVGSSEEEITPEYEFLKINHDPVLWAAATLGVIFDGIHYDRDGDEISAERWHQKEVLRCSSQFKVYLMGRRSGKCLVEGTLVQTPFGPVPIETLKHGDPIYAYDPETDRVVPSKVIGAVDQGIKDVIVLGKRGRELVGCTEEHVWHTQREHGISKGQRAFKDFPKSVGITTKIVKTPLGMEVFPHAYALGALLGDGCSTYGVNAITISSESDLIPNKVGHILGAKYIRSASSNNFSWTITNAKNKGVGYSKSDSRVICELYDDWCKSRKAHEKIADLEVIKKWDRASCLAFLAGLVDTDGSIYMTEDNCLVFSIGMQAKSVIDAIKYLVLALFSIQLSEDTDNRTKYKNGPVHILRVKNNREVLRILEELDPHLVIPRKKLKECYKDLVFTNSAENYTGVRKLREIKAVNTWDIMIEHPSNLYLLANGFVTHNTYSMRLETLFFMLTNKEVKVLLICPYEKQVLAFLKDIDTFIEKNPEIKASVKHRSKSKHTITFNNGSHLESVMTGGDKAGGGSKARGQPADLLVFEECDYISASDIESAIAILADNPKCRILASSTPTGKREFLYNIVTDKSRRYKSFQYTSHVSPVFTKVADDEVRAASSSAAYRREILAEFGDEAAGVFSQLSIDRSLRAYQLSSERSKGPQPKWSYMVGVDWNGRSIGTHIVVTGFNPATTKYKVVDKIIVANEAFTQINGCKAIVDAFHYWNASHIYTDFGFGEVQSELITRHAVQTNDQKLAKSFKPITMNGNTEVRNPASGQLEKKNNQQLAIDLLAHHMEQARIELPSSEDFMGGDESEMGLVSQMRHFVVDRVTSAGKNVYSGVDHTLTAFYLTILAFQLEKSSLGHTSYDNKVLIRASGNLADGANVTGVAERNKEKAEESGMSALFMSRGMDKNKMAPNYATPKTRVVTDGSYLKESEASIKGQVVMKQYGNKGRLNLFPARGKF